MPTGRLGGDPLSDEIPADEAEEAQAAQPFGELIEVRFVEGGGFEGAVQPAAAGANGPSATTRK